MRRLIAAASLAVLAAGCSEKDIEITNPNVTLSGAVASDPTALQLLATGLMGDQRGTHSGQMTLTGILGREMYTFSPNEGRNTTNYLVGITVNGVQQLDPAGFANGGWGGQYGLLRDAYNFINFINGAGIPAKAKSVSLGFAETLEAEMMLEVVQTRDTLGGITQILDDPFALAPFVSRDSMYKYVLNTLDDAATKLADTTAFPFKLVPGFTSSIAGAAFDTPAGFLKFNRALKARAAANYATAGGGSAAWQATLDALAGSFINDGATTRAAFDVGVYDTYAPAPDSPNPLTYTTNTNLYAHMSIKRDAQLQAGGQPDQRYLDKVLDSIPTRRGPGTGADTTSAASNIGYKIWASTSSPIAVIRNEELILLRAEARLATGNKQGAIDDINIVRVNSGKLPPSTLTTASTDDQVLDGILYEKRYSLLLEAQRWVDARRYNRLNTLPIDVTAGTNKNFVAKVVPIPQAECLNRKPLGGAFVGPNGLIDCP